MVKTEYYNKYLDMLDENYFKGTDTEDSEEDDISLSKDDSDYSGRIILSQTLNVYSFYQKLYKKVPDVNLPGKERFESISDSLRAERISPEVKKEVYCLKSVLDSLSFIMEYRISLIRTKNDEFLFSKEAIAGGKTYTEEQLLSGYPFQEMFYNNGKYSKDNANHIVTYGLVIDFLANNVTLDIFMRNLYRLWKMFLTTPSFNIFKHMIQFWRGDVKYMYKSSYSHSFGYYRPQIVAFYDAIYGTQEYLKMSPEEDDEFSRKYPESYGNCSSLTKYLLYVDRNKTKINEDYDVFILGYERSRGTEIIFDLKPKSKYADDKEVFINAVKEIFVNRIKLIQETENKLQHQLINLYAMSCPQFCDGKNNPEQIDELDGTPVMLFYIDENIRAYPVKRQKKMQELDYHVKHKVLPGWSQIKKSHKDVLKI